MPLNPLCCPRPVRPAPSQCHLTLSFHLFDQSFQPLHSTPPQGLHSALWTPLLWPGGTGRSQLVRPRVLHLQLLPRRISRAYSTPRLHLRASPKAGVLSCRLDAQNPSAFTLRSLGLAPVRAAVTSLLYKVFVPPSFSASSLKRFLARAATPSSSSLQRLVPSLPHFLQYLWSVPFPQ